MSVLNLHSQDESTSDYETTGCTIDLSLLRKATQNRDGKLTSRARVSASLLRVVCPSA